MLLRAAKLVLATGLACIVLGLPVQSRAEDRILLVPLKSDLPTGRYSPFARFSQELYARLSVCKSNAGSAARAAATNGRIGGDLKDAIKGALACGVGKDIPKDSAAYEGAITEGLWRAVMQGESVPSLSDRVESMILSFEATDFTEPPEWNFCQDNADGSAPNSPNFVCRNKSDPCSYLTWGPRGATAGSGREIQWILWLVEKMEPGLLAKTFGTEYRQVQRFFHLKGEEGTTCAGPLPIKVFLCNIWVDPVRRAIWDQALEKLGEEPVVRRAYRAVYGFSEFDGGKLAAYFKLWSSLGLKPTELDYAFFMDRSTHYGAPFDDDADEEKELVATMRKCIVGQQRSWSDNGKARRCLSLTQPHETQAEARLARDVAFYIDAYEDSALTDREVNAWAGYLAVSAMQNFGLSDERQIDLGSTPSVSDFVKDEPTPNLDDITAEEIAKCPGTVLFPVN